MTQRVGPPAPTDDPSELRTPPDSEVGLPENVQQQQRQAVIDWARTGQASKTLSSDINGVTPPFQPFPSGGVPAGVWGPGMHGTGTQAPDSREPDSRGPNTREPDTREPIERGPNFPNATDNLNTGDTGHVRRDQEDVAPWEVDATAATEPPPSPSVCYLGFQVHNRYLVTQDESGMVVIDQHALHERVLYERVTAKVLEEGSSLESQRLLVPEPVSLTAAERTAALDAKETLAKIGIEIDDFGGETILIQSYPAILGRTRPGDMLRTLPRISHVGRKDARSNGSAQSPALNDRMQGSGQGGRPADAAGNHESAGAERPLSRYAPLSAWSSHGTLLQSR